MLKRFLPLLVAPLLLAGCSATFTNLTPSQQTRNPNHVYPVSVALASRQQTLRWDTIRPEVVVGKEVYPLRPTALMTNRWEGLIPVPAGKDVVHYHYKFDYNVNAFGKPGNGSAESPEYTLKLTQ